MRSGPVSSSSTGIVPIIGAAAARAERARRVQEAADRFHAEAEVRHRAYAGFEARWTPPVIDDIETAAQRTQPRGAFLAQLIAQEELGPGLTLDDSAGQVRAYRRAARRPIEIRTGANLDLAA